MKGIANIEGYALLSVVWAFILILCITPPLVAQESIKIDYIQKKQGDYFAVLELPGDEYLVIGTRSMLRRSMRIDQMFGNVGNIELLVSLTNGRQQYINGRVMDNGRNRTFYSKSSARQFVRRLTE
ncbi:hypothetical protein NC796_12510 [Aliifodinibius sp. S!AR15-10]|uniref:hypothetical protein n=1 Tax=Aliifodinibius sp. S!AR15-10 TaxID=2950437 RepID=UPI0028543E2B|nr:hypothetical protein [Aliifodinibius sp. S!AR15-10]MDR8391972.1 hypothetical protein [Aliifodinibius sp. S!AR15-10]